ncbi:MAG: DNA translocase FtsK [Acidimicrobiia bacterium]|jgi:S-DNA-T family DNA segregation ATPase FtsK/SpoIIIE
MATRTASRSGASRNSRSSTKGKGKSGRARATKAPAKSSSKATRAPRRSAEWDRRRDDARRQLRGHGPDAAAIVLLIVGVLTALGLVGDAAGGIGRGLASVSGALFGLARYAVPFVTIGLAVLCFFWRPGGEVPLAAVEAAEDDEVPEGYAPRAPWRVGLGLGLLCVAGLGILDLATGAPPLDAPLDELRDAAGLVGALIGAPLVALAGTTGAAVILGGVVLLGVLLVPGIPMRDVLAGIGRALRWAGHRARSFTDLHPPAEGDDAIDDSDAAVDSVGGTAEPPPGFRDDGFVDDEIDDLVDIAVLEVLDEPDPEPDLEPEVAPVLAVVTLYDVEADADHGVPVVDAGPGKQMAIDLGPAPKPGSWKLPSANILKKGDGKGVERRFVEEGGKVLEAALHQHGVDAKLIGMTVGPTVTRYELELAPGVKVNRVTGLSHDIAYAMASPDVRILAPIPGRSAIGVEVPNRQRQLVTLGDILTSKEAKDAKHPLEVGLGRGIDGKPVMLNLATLPHVLIAGSTGAGKSSCINSLVTSLLIRNTPDQVRLILVDPKRVELGAYNDTPHLLTPVVTNPKKAANALEWAVREMDLRYEVLAEAGVRDITGYNAMFDRGDLPTPESPDPVTGRGYERLPFIVIVVDELNDLMMVAARDVEASIVRISQMARAVGIHLVIATQRPSVDVITGVIKANVPSRLAFSVTSLADSRVILDQAGAEKLIGKGDLLMVTASSSRAERVQCAWVDEECVRKVAAHWRRQVTEPEYVSGIADEDPSGAGGDASSGHADDDELLGEAMNLVVRSGLGSTSMLQRKLRVGFARAGRLMDLLERRGIVGPSEGSKARTVLMTVEELEQMEARGAVTVPEVD